MKSLLTLVAALAACGLTAATVEFSEDQKQLMKQLRGTCMAETSVDEPTIDACATGKFSDDPKLKCYLKCTFQQMTVMDDDGIVDADTMLSMLPEGIQEQASPILNTCKDVRGADACDNAFLFNKCLYDKAPQYYVVI